ncbi:F0F1 ATP synthase subunit A [Candidatus Saccharibacteria bacterium]|nr:F0F1 ATP synthase subunit A [Candidatus Saccharibacteria bacterium]
MSAVFAVTEPLAAEVLFSFGPLPVTNSMVFGIVTVVLVLGLFGFAARASQLWPKNRLAYWFESLTELVMGMIIETFGGDRKRALRHFPLLITLFVFILASNLSGLLPGVGTITHGHTPLLRAWTTDLNSTLAMATLALATVHIYAIKEIGGMGYVRHFFSGNLKNPMNIFIGLNELFGEVLRLVTLSLRLFGVIYGGEALLFAIAALAGNFAWAATLPIMFLEIFVAFVQAYLFMMLTASYLMMSTSHNEPSESHLAQPVGVKS